MRRNQRPQTERAAIVQELQGKSLAELAAWCDMTLQHAINRSQAEQRMLMEEYGLDSIPAI